jgi:membrane protein DedA with SNARE-associated domain
MLEQIAHFLVNFANQIGYPGVYLYMLLVGTFIPVPSELILLPSGYLASQGEKNFLLLWICAALGSLSGALINYFLAQFLIGRFISKRKVVKLMKFWRKHGKISAFLAPLTPGLGQYISIPAGLSKMPLRWFIPLTFSANLIWTGFLLSVGYLFGTGDKAHKSAMLGSAVLLGIVILVAVGYTLYQIRKDRKEERLSLSKIVPPKKPSPEPEEEVAL